MPHRPRRTPKAEALTELILEVFRFRGELERHGRRIVEPFGQTPTGWLVLGALEEGPRTVPQIGRRMGVTRQGVQRVADALVKNGLASFGANPDHRRSPMLRLTPRGRQVLGRIDALQARWANRLAEPLSRWDLESAVHTVQMVIQRLKAPVGDTQGGKGGRIVHADDGPRRRPSRVARTVSSAETR